MPEFDRRDFLKLVSVGAGTAASGCYRYSELPEKLIPYVVQPEEITPGMAVHYASTCQECPAGCGLHVRTREGRPVKLEGNPEHPVNRGALCARGQAGIGRTYHPDRFRVPMLRGADGKLEAISWERAAQVLADQVQAAGARTHVLGGRTGPTLGALIDRWIEAVGAGGRIVYEPFAYESLRQAAAAVFGVEAQPDFDLSDTDYVIDFGADSLDAWLSPTEHQRQLKAARSVESDAGRKARFVYVGPRLSTTAGNADEWLPARPGSEGLLALGIARVAFDERSAADLPVGGDAQLIGGVLRSFDADSVAEASGIPAETIRRIGHEIARARRPVALPPGVALTSRRATASAGAVLLLDAVVGAVGRSVRLPAAAEGPVPASMRDLAEFVDSMQEGGVSLLLIHDANPAHSLPPDIGFHEALEQVEFVVSFASLPDETTAKAHLVLPDHTPLESWGDAAPREGVRSLVQPSLRPLYDTQAMGDTLLQSARLLGAGDRLPSGSFRSVLEAAWADTDWRAALRRGGVWRAPAAGGGAVVPEVAKLEFEEPQLEGDGSWVLLPVPSPLLYDGRGANLAWLQETPDPVTKVSWQSWLEVSKATAAKLDVTEGDVVAVETSVGRAEVPVFVRGGIRDDVAALAIGQGHSVGRYASRSKAGSETGEARGVNVISLLPALTDETGGRAWLTARAVLSRTGAHRRLANTQRDDNKRGRQLGEAITLAAFAQGDWNADARGALLGNHGEKGHGGGNAEVGVLAASAAHGAHADEAPQAAHGAEPHEGPHEILRPFEAGEDSADESPYRWGMVVDLDRCSGCSACVVACSIENNIPSVGEDAVLRNRQMQWLRIERFIGHGTQRLETGRPATESHEELGDVDVRHSPMMCQQCGAAPCEPVCPVFATYHNEEGLNGMIYNRCIGTRYCSNNCPYKVRRFNWFDYAIHNWPEPMQLMLNPDVTVRGQGVMEKCTFCIQRIQSARQGSKDSGVPIQDDQVTTACAQTCPSDAISFGNVKNGSGSVAKLVQENAGRSYHSLHVLNTRPGVTYLAKIQRNESEEKHG